MSYDPLALPTISADEEWDETLDLLACAIAREMDDRGLLSEGARDAARYHFRGYARRLLNPVLEDVRGEVQAGYREVIYLRELNRRLLLELHDLRRARRTALRRSIAAGTLTAMLVLAAVAAIS